MDIVLDNDIFLKELSKEVSAVNIDKNFLVSISNEMIEKPYSLTATEQIIIELLASNIQPNDKEFKPLQFKTKDFMNALGIKNKSTYREVESICKGLLEKGFTHRYTDETGNKKTLMINWLSSAEVDETGGTIELRFDDKLKPYLLKLNELKSGFTSYKLINPINLRGAKDGYHIRIYKLLKKYQKLGNKKVSVLELREMLGIEASKYKSYTDFKKWIIVSAQKNINSKTDIEFSFNEFKSGRKIAYLEFIIKKNAKNKEYDIPKEYLDALKDEELYEELISYGIKAYNANIYIDRYTIERIRSNIAYAKEQQDSGKVKYFSSYLNKAITQDYSKKANLFSYNKQEGIKEMDIELEEAREQEKRKVEGENIVQSLKYEYDKHVLTLIKKYLTKHKDSIQAILNDYLSNADLNQIGKADLLIDKDSKYIIDNIDNIDYIKFKRYIKDKYIKLSFIEFAKDKGYILVEHTDIYSFDNNVVYRIKD